MNKKLYTRWWFWVAVVILVVVAWYVKGYITWRGEMAPYIEYNRTAQEYWQTLERQSADWEKRYKEDRYGGDTPEETLELYIQALEAGDLELASKYYIPEEQDFMAKDLVGAKFLKEYIQVLALDREVSISDEFGRAEIEFVDSEGKSKNIEFLQLNPYTQKWKLFSNE